MLKNIWKTVTLILRLTHVYIVQRIWNRKETFQGILRLATQAKHFVKECQELMEQTYSVSYTPLTIQVSEALLATTETSKWAIPPPYDPRKYWKTYLKKPPKSNNSSKKMQTKKKKKKKKRRHLSPDEDRDAERERERSRRTHEARRRWDRLCGQCRSLCMVASLIVS